jgi:prephenate dehydrogenase
MSALMFDRLVVIGMGLMGSSVLRAAQQKGLAKEFVGVARGAATAAKALELGLVGQAFTRISDVQPLEGGTELILVAAPVQQMAAIFASLQPLITPGTLITDVGSTKASVVDSATEAWGEMHPNFVPAHPIAGSEQSGVESGKADLFVDHWVLLTPVKGTHPAAQKQVAAFWQALGAKTEVMDVEHHDEVLGATSHLPHLLAYALVDTLATQEDSKEVFRYAAGGFRDFTRIAESDPQMWHDILLANGKAVLQQLEGFEQHLDQLREAVKNKDSVSLMTILERAQQARRNYRHAADGDS